MLRRYDDADAPGLLTLVESNRAQLPRSFATLANGVLRIGDAASFVRDKAGQWDAGTTFCCGIRPKPTMPLIGRLQVKNIAWDIPAAELSCFIDAAFGKLAFARLSVRIIASNHGSIALANRLGFRHEGLLRNTFRCGHGELHDVHHFSLAADDLPLRPAALGTAGPGR